MALIVTFNPEYRSGGYGILRIDNQVLNFLICIQNFPLQMYLSNSTNLIKRISISGKINENHKFSSFSCLFNNIIFSIWYLVCYYSFSLFIDFLASIFFLGSEAFYMVFWAESTKRLKFIKHLLQENFKKY